MVNHFMVDGSKNGEPFWRTNQPTGWLVHHFGEPTNQLVGWFTKMVNHFSEPTIKWLTIQKIVNHFGEPSK